MATERELGKMSIKELRALSGRLARQGEKIREARHAISALIRARQQEVREPYHGG